MNTSHTPFITGAAGYIGTMLADMYSKRSDVEKVICLDREHMPELLKGNSKIIWIKAYTNDNTWQEQVSSHNPDIIIHTAWQIRELYNNQQQQWIWNVDGSVNVFEFAFSHTSVKKLIHYSTVSSYSALPTNTLEHIFKEEEGFRDSVYLYAQEKKVVEDRLRNIYEKAVQEKTHTPQISIIRPASITGPRGRYGRTKLNLQSALSGQLKDTWTHKLISALLSYMPITPLWCRQFVHEDDICDTTTLLAFEDKVNHIYEAYNICPPGPVVLGKDMAQVVGKKTITLHPIVLRCVFFLAWHLSLGKIPTSRGGWLTYSYPIVVDGSKISKSYGYVYKMGPLEAISKREGRYMSV
jgi:nucleoside-diphosphate-sugar epimerase